MSLRRFLQVAAATTCVAAFFVLGIAGCGGGSSDPTTPRSVPSGAVAIIGTHPVSEAAFRHWLPILRRSGGNARARAATVTFLVKAQWLSREAEAEGIDHATLEKLVAERAATSPEGSSMTAADLELRARLDIIFEALRQRHEKVDKVGGAAVVAYYSSHRSAYRLPATRETLMVVTRTRGAGLAARAALASGRPWAAVARRWSSDSSAAVGGRYVIVPGIQSPRLVHAAFAAPQGRLVGPLRAMPPAAQEPEYWLFRVLDGTPTRLQSFSGVAPQIRQLLGERRSQHALTTFEDSFERRWRARTLCAPGYVVPECGN